MTCRREATRPPPPSAAATPAGARPTPRFAEGATPTRDRLPAVAARLASEGGALAIGVEPVARAAGVGPGAVIRHVSGRDEGARALLAQVAEEVEADLAALTAWGLRFTGALIEATFAEVKERSGLLATLIAALAATRTSRHRSGGASRPGPAAWWRRTAWAGLRRRPCASPSTGLILSSLIDGPTRPEGWERGLRAELARLTVAAVEPNPRSGAGGHDATPWAWD